MMQPELLQNLFDEAGDLLVILQSNRTLLATNPAFRRNVAGTQAGVDFMDLVPPKARSRVLGELVRAAGGEEVMVEVPHADADGRGQLVEYRFFPLEGGMVAGVGRPRGGRLTDRDALERVRSELRSQTRMLDEIQLELTQVPFIDPVTGVWNRIQVFERLTSEWSRCERFASPLTLLIVEVPGVEEVQSVHGQAVAEGILKAVARRLKATVRDHDIVGRYAGNQFVVVAVHADYEGAMSLSRRIRDMVTFDPVSVEDQTIQVNVHIGGATSRSAGVEILEDLFRVAEEALGEVRGSTEAVKVVTEMRA
jgi:diguanylate cyclase (GGDEF)-like protein